MGRYWLYVERGETIMGTTIRPEISERNKYWIDKHRYYELKHFCLQYPIWKKAYICLSDTTLNSRDLITGFIKGGYPGDPTSKIAIIKHYYADRMNMIERAAKDADPVLYSYIIKAVTEGLSYTYLKTHMNIPCGRDMYYERYRCFFWLLNKIRQ